MKLIDKAAVVAEIERRIESCAKQREDMLNVQCHALADDASARMGELNCIQDFLDTLEVKEVNEEPVSEELEKAHIWKPADGDDLPECDREVIAILDYDFGHYKVVYAHRPNPNRWNGTNIDTGEKEHFEPEIYDKGGWNQPYVLYWLDAKLPYEEK